MSVAGYTLAIVRLAVIAASAVVTARGIRSALAPDWSGALRALADVITSIAIVVVTSEVLGSVGLFTRVALLPTLAAAAGLTIYARRRSTEPALVPPGRALVAGIDRLTVAASTGLVIAEWTSWVVQRVSTGVGNAGGPGDGDSLWYHMTFAANFVRTGWTSAVRFLNGDALVAYYPANMSLLHAVGILAMGNDSLSPFLNIALLPVGLLAGWCIAEDAGFGPAGLAAVAVAMTIPVVAVTEPGTAKDDVLGFVGLVATLAFIVHPQSQRDAQARRAAAVFGGLSAGLALGSKLTLVAPVVALSVGLAILAPRTERLRTFLTWSGATLASGGYWYLRNLIVVGNPLPGLRIGVGSLRLPHPPTPNFDMFFGFDLWHVITNGQMWRVALIPGFRLGLGPAWVLIVATLLVTTVLSFGRLRKQELVLPLAAVVSIIAFAVTPGTVWIPQLIHFPGAHVLTTNLFGYNLRYLLPAIAIGLVSLAVVASRWRRGRFVVLGALGVMLLSTQLATGQKSNTAARAWSGHGFIAVPAGIAAAALAAWLIRPSLRHQRIPTWALAATAGIALGLPVESYYVTHRFAYLPLSTWATHIAPAKIGYSGFMFSYPLFGPGMANRVEMLGEHGPDGSWHPVSTCLAWRRQERAGHFKYIVVPVGPTLDGLGIDLARWRAGLPGGVPPDEVPEARWTRDDPGATLVFQGQGAGVYTVTGPATPINC